MALDITTLKRRSRAPLLILATVVCFAVAAALLYDALFQRGGFQLSKPYTYNISQSVSNNVSYVDNSYFPNGPATNTAYISDLTDSFTTTFHYAFKGSTAQELEYTYSVNAVVRGTYGVPGGSEDTSNVWAKQFQLVEPTTNQVDDDQFSIDETVKVPFAQYRKLVEDFRLGLGLPVTSQVELRFNVRVGGMVGNEPLSDSRESTVSTPLNVQIYQLATKYDKADTKELSARPASPEGRQTVQAELIGGILLIGLGLFCLGLSMRPGAERTAYQRELRKIYRYHDGIIIRTSRPMKISSNKTVVPVKSFDDILNIEEETKSPIIASSLASTATRFLIADEDIIYSYVLGEVPIELVDDDFQSIESTLAPNHQSKIARPATKRSPEKPPKRRLVK